jgi:hypothetical protein
MSRITTKQEFLDDIHKEWELLDNLLREIPENEKLTVVTDSMSVKDFLAHRTEWGRMMLAWYRTEKKGKKAAVPTDKYKWNQLRQLNAHIYTTYKDVSLKKIERDFKKVHDELQKLVEGLSDNELFTKEQYNFTGTSDLATYLNSSTAAHYRSARRHIQRWWKRQSAKTDD